MKKTILISLLLSLVSCSNEYKYFCIDRQPYYLKYYCMEYIDVKRKAYRGECNPDSLIFTEIRAMMLRIDDDHLARIKELYDRR